MTETLRDDDQLDRAMRAGFGRKKAGWVGSSVFAALEGAAANAPRIRLSGSDTPAEADLSDAGRYQVVGEIARGGMGAILKSRDTDLGREIAMKVLLESHAGSQAALHRFVEEAQIGGQLQHPGITPVYEMGLRPDRRPFFTMKLVKGETLAALLTDRPDATHDLDRYLSIFEHVAQTIAYAHARGVVHRDLKPSNIMVGSYGEVLVVDWGLAKVLQSGGVADEQVSRIVETVRSERAGSQSMVGSVVGTPNYMPPEQARGQVDLVDERADVFSLGGILCEILTMSPPYTGPDQKSVVRAAAEARMKPIHDRLDGSGADAVPIDLAKRCLSPSREQRPRHAAAVARAVIEHRSAAEARAREAQLTAVAEQARVVEERKARRLAQKLALAEQKRRRLTGGLAAAVLAAVLVVGGGLFWLDHSKGERIRQRTAAVEQAIREANDHLGRADVERTREVVHLSRGVAAAKRAVDVAVTGTIEAGAGDRARELHDRIRKREAAACEAERLRHRDRQFLTRLTSIGCAVSHVETPVVSRRFAAAFLDFGIDTRTHSEDEIARRISATSCTERLAGFLDDWSALPRLSKSLAVKLAAAAARADLDPLRRGLRGVADPKEARKILDRADVQSLPPATIRLAASILERAGDRAAALDYLRTGCRLHPGDFDLNYRLARRLMRVPRGHREALPFATAATILAPDHGGAWDLYGGVLHRLGRNEESLAAHDRAVAMDAQNHDFHLHRGLALRDLGRLAEAAAANRESLRLHPGCALASSNLATVLSEMGRLDEAQKLYEAAMSNRPDQEGPYLGYGAFLSNKLGEHERADAVFRSVIARRPEEARAHANLAITLEKRGRHADALKAHAEAVRLEPRNTDYRVQLGASLSRNKRPEEAENAFREALRQNPRHAKAHHNLAAALWERGRLQAAERHCRLAIRLAPGWVEPYRKLASLLEAQQRFDEALGSRRKVAQLLPDDFDAQNDLGVLLYNLRRFREAVGQFERAKATDPENAVVHNNHGNALAECRRFGEAETAYRWALELDPELPNLLNNLGFLLKRQGRTKEALALLRRAIEKEPKDYKAWCHLGDLRFKTGDATGAEEAYATALETAPAFVPAIMRMISLFKDQKRWDEVVDLGREAVRRSPEHPDLRYEYGRGLVFTDQLKAALHQFRECIRIAPTHGGGHYEVASTLVDLGEHKEALLHFRRTIELNPGFLAAYMGLGAALNNRLSDHDEAVRVFREAEKRWPTDPKLLYNLGTALVASGDYAEAAKVLRRGLDIKPSDESLRRNLAIALLESEKVDDALKEYRSVVRLRPKDPKGYFVYGVALYELKKYDDAIRQFEKVLELDSEDHMALYQIACSLFQKNDYASALVKYREYLAKQPASAGAWVDLGNLFQHMKRPGEAIEAYRKAIALEPKQGMGRYQLALMLKKRGKRKEAIQHLRAAVEAKPAAVELRFRLAFELVEDGRWEEAIRHYRDVVERDPAHAMARNNLGNLFRQMGRYRESLALLEQAIKLVSNNALSYSNIGVTRCAMGQFKEALAAHKIALRSDPQMPGSLLNKKHCERMLKVEPLYGDFLAGRVRSCSPDEKLLLAQIAFCRERYVLSTRLFREGFAEAPSAMEDMREDHRYHAACAASRALAGEGEDAEDLTPERQATLRRDILEWLRADLAHWRRRVTREPDHVLMEMALWRHTVELRAVRDAAFLDKLPTDERQAFRAFWKSAADVFNAADAVAGH